MPAYKKEIIKQMGITRSMLLEVERELKRFKPEDHDYKEIVEHIQILNSGAYNAEEAIERMRGIIKDMRTAYD